MSEFDDLLQQMSGEENERLLEIARFAELGMSASAIIHELRQPLTALSMALQMTEETARGKDAEVERGVRESIQLVAKVEMLLERARDFMRPSTGLDDLDIEEAITRVFAVFHWQLNGKPHLRLESSVKNSPLLVRGDKAQIEQMLANLISNALDAVSEKGSGTVHVMAFRNTNDEVEIVVADDGSGISEETESHMFEPFYTTKGAGKGTGLGLFIVSKIASRHGAICSFLDKKSLESLGLGDVTTGFSVRFAGGEQ